MNHEIRWNQEQSTKNSAEAQGDAALARAIANGDHEALVAAIHTGKARIRSTRQHTAG